MVRHLALRLYVCDHRSIWPDRFRAGTVPVFIFCDAQSGGGEEIYISRLSLGGAHWHGRRDGPPKSHDRRQQRKFAELPDVLWHRPSHSGGPDQVFGKEVTEIAANRNLGADETQLRNLSYASLWRFRKYCAEFRKQTQGPSGLLARRSAHSRQNRARMGALTCA